LRKKNDQKILSNEKLFRKKMTKILADGLSFRHIKRPCKQKDMVYFNCSAASLLLMRAWRQRSLRMYDVVKILQHR